ncbi:hypothetical protein ITP53_03245 [Nonomuraea sp. K274]|uniref:HEXXH motif-containing protein n=1 Tax=Nonomuraea cypriaca TaxID=1187855 RepID=A0A931A663_9ACTN|nr:HEXXH motif-containing putative peptide modification protein [Nonomuraea cypriaca]MBF8184773.1 hypothetical protein [Nonomuraea cypriaca]
MTELVPSVLACVGEDDPYQEAFVSKRCVAIRVVLPALVRRLPEQAGSLIRSALADYERKSPEAQREVVMAPLFGYWWHRLSLGYQRGDVAELMSWVEHLPRLIEPTTDNDHVVLRDQIVVDSGHPWITEYITTANAKTQLDRNQGDVAPAPPGEAVAGLTAALDLIDAVWPEMGREINLLVKQIVPIHSAETVAFSNTVLNGLIFLRTDLDDVAVAAERIIHETSHLRMNAVFHMHPVHQHPPEERLHSPYRKVPRPVDGLYHGAFVFARIARFLLRAHTVAGGDVWLSRLHEVHAMQTEALELIENSVRLTPLGRAQFQEFREVAREISAKVSASALH